MENNLKDQHYKNMGIMLQMETLTFEAESVAYTVCQYFGLDTSDYSFPYIAGWSSSMDMKELRTSMDTIRKTAGSFIDSMTEVIQRLMREQPELSLSAMKQAEILIDRVEQERTLFSGEERNLLVNYAYKFDNAEETEKLIRKLAEAKAIPDPPQKSAGIYKKKSSFSLMAWWE